MTKKELITNLQNKFYKIGLVRGVEDNDVRAKEGIQWFLIGVYENSDNVLIRRNISVYCEMKGDAIIGETELPEGNYFYADKEPVMTIQKPKENIFKDVEGIVTEQGSNFVVVKRYDEIDGKAVEKKVLVREEKELEIE